MPDTISLPLARIEQLTSLRFFAALAVLASHLWPLAEEPNPLQPIARTLFHEGYAGVSFFFMLSGFILSHTYQAKLTSGAISRGKYLTLRVARIAPLHWLCGVPLAIWALATVGGPESGLGSLPSSLTNLALLQSWVPQVKWYFSLNEPSWSLSDELFFYTMFVWLAFLPLRRLGAFAALLLLGDASFALYLIHLPIIHAALALRDHYPDSLPLLPLCGGTALIAIGLSVVVYRKVELPLLARSRRMIGRAFPRG